MPPYTITPYGSRFFALYDQESLIAVTVYKKGARTVAAELVRRDREIAQRSPAREPESPSHVKSAAA